MEKILEQHAKRVEEHFADDKKAFAKIDELFLINGEHMSHAMKDIAEIRQNVVDIKHILARQDEMFIAHRNRVEPAIKTHEEALIIKANDEARALKLGKMAAVVGAVTTLGYAIIWIIRKVV